MIIKYSTDFSQEESRKILNEPIFSVRFKFGINDFIKLNAFSDEYIAIVDKERKTISLWTKKRNIKEF